MKKEICLSIYSSLLDAECRQVIKTQKWLSDLVLGVSKSPRALVCTTL